MDHAGLSPHVETEWETFPGSELSRLLSSPIMVHCPRCGKNFLDESRVVNHMNQPISSCLIFYEEVTRMNEALAASKAQDASPSPRRSPSPQDQFPPSSSNSIHDQDPFSEHMDVDQGDEESEQLPTPPFRVDYPGASQTYGKGTSFMDVFEQDAHSLERRAQPYYPFASNHEWEMASFLLRSNLSMKSIDKFLKLHLVRLFFLRQICLLMKDRLPNLASHFGLQKTCATERKCFLQVQLGSAFPFRQCILQKTKSIYTVGTQLNAWKR